MEWEKKIVPFEVEGRCLAMVFTTAVLLQVEKKFGGLDALGDKMKDGELETAIWLVSQLANQGAMLRAGKTSLSEAEEVTVDWLALYLPPNRLRDISEASMDAVNLGMRSETLKPDENAEIDVVLEELSKNGEGAGA